MRVALVGGNGKTGRAVREALARRGTEAVSIGRAEWPNLARAMASCEATYLIAPNLHPDEPAYVADVLTAMRQAGVSPVVYHSVASRCRTTWTRPSASPTLARSPRLRQSCSRRRATSAPGTSLPHGWRPPLTSPQRPAASLGESSHPWLVAMFSYYDHHGLPVGTRPLSMLLGR